jgi:hypothetical protein
MVWVLAADMRASHEYMLLKADYNPPAYKHLSLQISLAS